jgi:hypothetical protein
MKPSQRRHELGQSLWLDNILGAGGVALGAVVPTVPLGMAQQ